MSVCVCVFFIAVYYNMLIAWACSYFVSSFKSPLPWTECGTLNGTALNGTCVQNGTSVSPEKLFWENTVLDLSANLGEPGHLNWNIVGCLAVSWLICWICVSRGVKSVGPAAWVLAIFPYVILTAMMIRAVTLPGAQNGIIFYLKPDFSRLLGYGISMKLFKKFYD